MVQRRVNGIFSEVSVNVTVPTTPPVVVVSALTRKPAIGGIGLTTDKLVDAVFTHPPKLTEALKTSVPAALRIPVLGVGVLAVKPAEPVQVTEAVSGTTPGLSVPTV